MFRDIYRTASRRAASFFSSKLNIFKAIYPEAAVAFTVTLALFFVLHTAISIAAPPPTPFEPGETLDPGCAPGEENCFVSETPNLSEVDSDDLEEGEANLYFTPERVSNHIDVLANTAARHAALTLSGSNYLTLTGQEMTAGTIDISDHTNLSVGAGLLLTDDSLSVTGLTTSHFASSNISQWANDSGFISSYTETDPIFTASDVSGVVAADITNWNTAFGWGDHSAAGYFSLDNKPSLSVIPPAESNFFGGLASAVNSGTIRTLHIRADSTFTFDQFFVHETTTESPRVTIYESDINENLLSTIQEFVSSDATVEIIDAREYRKYELLEAQIIESGEYILIELDYSENPSTWNRVKGSGDDDLPLTDGDLTLVGLGGTTSSHGKDIILRSGDPIPKGVVGPLDPTDLPGYGLATEGQVLTRTANGAEFTTLTTGNFATPNISQWTNDSGFITDLSTFDASDLSILDSDDNFAALSVEDALSELYAQLENKASSIIALSDIEGAQIRLGHQEVTFTSGTFNDRQFYFKFTPTETLLITKIEVPGWPTQSSSFAIWRGSTQTSVHSSGANPDVNGLMTKTFAPALQLDAGEAYYIGGWTAGGAINWPKSIDETTYNNLNVEAGVYECSGYNCYPNNGPTQVGTAWPNMKIYVEGGDVIKNVMGPIDPNDLGNYASAASNTFLRKTSDGLEFTAFPSDEQFILSGLPQGGSVGAGSLYINPPQNSSGLAVAWTRNSDWDSLDDVGSSARPGFADLDGDGDFDMMVGNSGGEQWAYENTGTQLSPTWARKAVWDGPTVGTRSSPSFADLNGDGDFDLMIGHYLNGTLLGAGVAYENTGNASAPVWTVKSEWDIPKDPAAWATAMISFADLDNDGDMDAVLAGADTEQNDNSWGYENTGTPMAPTWVRQSSWDLPSQNASGYQVNSFGDLDGDGDIDAITFSAGNGGSDVYGIENTGSVNSPTWVHNVGWDMEQMEAYQHPILVDLDDDGDLDLMSGLNGGSVVAHENTGASGGTSNTLFGVAVNDQEKFRINASGKIYATGDMHATGFVNTSTEEAKENITFLTADRERNILSDIRTLDIANYRYLTDEVGEPLRLGLIAERSPSEILSADGKGVDLYKLSTFTLAGLKSLTEKVDGLESALLLDGVVLGGVGDEEIKPQNPFVAALKKVGLTIMDGILSIKKLITGEVKTDKLCVGDTCVTETEFLEILQNVNVEPHSEETPTNEPENGEEDPAQEGPEETPEPEEENETLVPDPEEETTPESEPATEDGVESEQTDPLVEGNMEEEGEDAETQDEGSFPEEGEAGEDTF